MNTKNNRSGIITTIVVAAVVLTLLNVCTFAIPFHKIDLSVHLTAYGCAEFVFLAEAVIILTQLFSGKDSNKKILSLPIVFFGYVTAFIQALTTFVFYLTNAFIKLPIWIVILVECVILGLGIVQVTKGFFFKARNEEYHENKASTVFMDEFRAHLKTLDQTNKNENIKKALEDLLDIALGSDPVTNDKTIEKENELQVLLSELEEDMKNGSEEKCRTSIEKAKNVLIERNALCKLGK